jgi:hypothetical protein
MNLYLEAISNFGVGNNRKQCTKDVATMDAKVQVGLEGQNHFNEEH